MRQDGEVHLPGETALVPQQADGGVARRRAAERLLSAGGQDSGLARLTELTARLLSATGPAVTVQVSVLTDVQTVVAAAGEAPPPTGTRSPLTDSLCTVTAVEARPLCVDDAAGDARVRLLPPVASGAVGAYLGVPLLRPDGDCLGALCAYSSATRAWSPDDVGLLEEVAAAVVDQLELRALATDYATSRVRWDLGLEAAEIGSFDLDLATGRLEWDERLAELFGYPPGQVPGVLDAALERVVPEDRAAVRAAIDAAVSAVGRYFAEYRVQLPDGRQRWLVSRGRALGSGGTATRVVGIAQDVSDQRNAHDEAARLLETMTTGFIALDRDWRVTYVNAEASRVVSRPASALVGRDVWEAFPGLEEIEFGRLYKAAVESGEPVEVEAFYPHLDGWFDVRAVPSPDGLSLFFTEVSSRHADRARADAATARLQLLARVSESLADAGFDTEGAVARLARLVVPELADWALVSLLDGPVLRDVGWWHDDPVLRETVGTYVQHRLVGRTDLGAVDRARQSGRTVVVESGLTAAVVPTLGSPEAARALTELAPESVVVVPLVARGHMVGLLTLLRGPDRAPMSADALTLAQEIGARAGLALDNAQLFAEQRSLADRLQQALLTPPPEPDHLHVVVRYQPAARAAQVGGDWYDAFLQPDGATVLVVGDVVGHDAGAAAAMGQLRGVLRTLGHSRDGDGPAQILSATERTARGLGVGAMATVVLARVELPGEGEQDRVLRWSNAGHLPPVLLHADGTVQVLRTDADLLLGVDPDSPRTEHTVALPDDSTLLLFTDGLVERRGESLDDGLARLAATLSDLRELPLPALCDELLARLSQHGREGSEDDIALLALRAHPQDRPRPVEAGPEDLPPDAD
jgi:PAS domain S-box-containing protein